MRAGLVLGGEIAHHEGGQLRQVCQRRRRDQDDAESVAQLRGQLSIELAVAMWLQWLKSSTASMPLSG